MPHKPTDEEKLQSEVMLDLVQHKGFRLLMSLIDKKGQRLLDTLLDATDNPGIPTEERRELVYQIACNLRANRELAEAVDTIIRGGKTDEELQALNPQGSNENNK